MSLGLILNVIVGFSVVDGRWRGREAILDLDFTISHRCKCQFCQKRFSLRVLALRRVCKQMTIVAMRPCCKTGAKVVLRRSTTLNKCTSKTYATLAIIEIKFRQCILKAFILGNEYGNLVKVLQFDAGFHKCFIISDNTARKLKKPFSFFISNVRL